METLHQRFGGIGFEEALIEVEIDGNVFVIVVITDEYLKRLILVSAGQHYGAV